MSTALVLLLLTTTAGDADNTLAPAVVRATREAVGAEAQIYTRTSPALPSDESAASLGNELHADGVVELTWIPPDGLGANIHAFRRKSGLWTDLEIHFKPADLPVERARTVGFAIASMFPEHLSEQPPATTPGSHETSTPGTEAPRTTRPPERNASAPVASHAVGASLIGGFPVGDSSGGMGGALDFRWTFAPPFGMRIGAALRIGDIPTAQVNSRFVSGSLGMMWDVWEAPGRQGAVNLRLDALVARLDFTRLAGEDETDQQSKWMPGTDLLLEASWFFVEGAGLVGGGGVEVLFGSTAVRVGDRTVTTMSPVRPVAELGLRARF